jgi:acyl-CoA hydrolase
LQAKIQTAEQTSVTRTLALSTDAALRRRFMVTDELVSANVRVGLLLEVLDKLAEETALGYVRQKYPEARVVTAAMDDLQVVGAPDVERDIVMRARVNFVGNTSMEVGIRLEQPGVKPLHFGSCYFTMAARMHDDQGERGVPLPPLEYTTLEDTRRAQRALARRHAHRKTADEEPPSREEYAMLRKLHEAQDKPEKAGAGPLLLAGALVTSGWERTYPEHENVPQTIFGGYVAHRAYMYAHICAEMVASQRPLLVSVDRINFYQPVRMGDKLHFVSRVTYTGNTSLTVETDITRISRDRTMTALSNACVFTFANVDAELNAMPVPQIYPTTYAEDARYLAGYRRQQAYLLRKASRS